MLKKVIMAACLAASAGIMLPSTAMAASEDECAIWLCLPGGFPSGCGAAHSAMRDRIKDFKPPLPPFSSCAVTPPGGFNMTSNHGVAAYVPERRVCTSEYWYGSEGSQSRCTAWRTIPAHYVRGTGCTVSNNDSGDRHPAGCTRTSRYIEVLGDGELLGPTYYWP